MAWKCLNCNYSCNNRFNKCWQCNTSRSSPNIFTGGLDDDDNDIMDENKVNKDEEIRVRVANKVFSLNVEMIQLSPILSKLHNDDMEKFVNMEQLLFDMIPTIFDINVPRDIVMTIVELTIAYIPIIQSNVIMLQTFKKIVTYFEYHKDNKVSRFVLPLSSTQDEIGKIITDEFDLKFVNSLDSIQIVQCISATNYLGITPLWQLLLIKVAISNKGKPFLYLNNRFGQDAANWIKKSTSNEWWL